jgi:hypothetical protein
MMMMNSCRSCSDERDTSFSMMVKWSGGVMEGENSRGSENAPGFKMRYASWKAQHYIKFEVRCTLQNKIMSVIANSIP